MALPEQIRKQTEAVQELYKQLNDADNNTGDTVADGTAAPSEPVSTPPRADEDTVSNTAAQPQGTDPSGISQEDDPNSETFAQKWRTLQGMYNAEVPRLHHQNREMQQRVQQMEQLLASMSSTQQATYSAPAIDNLVSEKEAEEYGESIDVMRKVSREELVPMAQRLARIETVLQQLQVNVVPQVQAVAHRQQMTTEQKFWSDLANMIPNWREINDNDAFQTWLLDIDPLTGITRQTYLEDAQRSLDALRVSSFFRTWLESTGQAVGQSAGNVNAAASELERQVTPGRSRGAGAPSSSANKGKMYSPQDIQKFFNDVRAGKYKGREQERDRTERDIFAAQRENRIIANA
jgi:hypothetical protein